MKGIYSDHVCADEAIHNVPLIVRWPGLAEPGFACDELLYTYDDFGYEFEPLELYDMEADKFQTHNLCDEQPELVAQMDHSLTEWLHEQSVKLYSIPDPKQVVLQQRQAKRA